MTGEWRRGTGGQEGWWLGKRRNARQGQGDGMGRRGNGVERRDRGRLVRGEGER